MKYTRQEREAACGARQPHTDKTAWARSVVQNVGAAAGSGVELAAQKRSETRIEQEDDVEELLKSDELVVDVKGNVNWEKAGLE